MKDCFGCKHCHLTNAEPGYSELTPGGPMYFRCVRNHWDFDEHIHSKKGLSTMISKAKDCPDYEIDDNLTDMKICPVCFKMVFPDQKGVVHEFCSRKCKKINGRIK